MDHPCLRHVPRRLRPDAERLLTWSPLFASLMRTADGDECRFLFQPLRQAELPDGGKRWVPHCDSGEPGVCMWHLRRCKQRAMRHLIWWELGLHGDIAASFVAIADFAAGLLEEALAMAMRLIAPRFGGLQGGRFCVIGLGKLGGRELNLGSDIDPLFIWQGEGNSVGGRRDVPAAEYFAHLSRMLIRLFAEHSEDGLVWPVDMRLRPGGDGAAIALSLDATLDFYQNYGQTWERAMLTKARPVAGDMALGEAFVEGVRPFVYRRYLDYTTVAALAEMKRRIDRQAGRQEIGAGFDVKRGRGGIREIEFIVQSMQLVHGGRHPRLRRPSTLSALERLREFGALPDGEAAMLRDAYCFWRRVEHAVQARKGEQTQQLPESFEAYLGGMLAERDVAATMEAYVAGVSEVFARHVLPMDGRETQTSWLTGNHDAELAVLDEDDRRRVLLALERLDAQLLRGLLPERSCAHVDAILARAMPRWLKDANGVAALEAFADLVHAIAGRATWIDLLATHRGALEWLMGVLSASRYLANHIVRDPSWLEWPLAAGHRRSDIDTLCGELSGLGDGDPEQDLAEIGRLVDRARIMAALAVDAHTAGPVEIGEWMSKTADAATRAVLRLSCRQLGLPADFPLVALAMGKHGSREMGLVSDLDMVFVLDCDDASGMLKGRSHGDHAQRLGRRMIHYLSGTPPFGAGFSFDARLRPSGASGALVTTLAGFHEYQLHEAQAWEHQALCRARPVAGPGSSRRRVADVVRQVLDMPRDPERLAAEVLSMRGRMLAHLASKSEQVINLKHDAGGLVDIEFLTQFARLAFGPDARSVVDILGGLITADAPPAWREHSSFLVRGWLDYRQMENALRVELWRSIGKLSCDASAPEWETMRRHAAIHDPDALKSRMRRVHEIFLELLRIS